MVPLGGVDFTSDESHVFLRSQKTVEIRKQQQQQQRKQREKKWRQWRFSRFSGRRRTTPW
jgi:hypothetical protein